MAAAPDCLAGGDGRGEEAGSVREGGREGQRLGKREYVAFDRAARRGAGAGQSA